MAVYAECPLCHQKRANKNKTCKCGVNLDRAKRSGKVKYWITYRLPGGRQRWESIGTSLKEARDADGKRKVQKRENRIFDILPEAKITFSELADWYLNLTSVKELASYDRSVQCFKVFNAVFGDWLLADVRQTDLEEYQVRRKKQGRAPATIDMEIKIVQAAVTKAFDNDMIDGRCLKAFRKTKRLLETGANARKAMLTAKQYVKLLAAASPHYKAVLTIAYNTGMRLGEIKALEWSYIDKDKRMIRLPAEVTKEGRAKDIPINDYVNSVLEALPRAIHHDNVITYNGKPLAGKSSLKKQFPETCQKAGVPHGRKTPGGITFHDIRRTVKTNMLFAGVDKVHRDAILGHSLKGMDAHYIVPTDDSLTMAMSKYTEWINQEVFSANVYQNVYQVQSKEKPAD